jgi:hypothetical protein
MNLVERWFGLITQQTIRRGWFSSVKELIQKIDAFVQHYNRTHHPFVRQPPTQSCSRRSRDLVCVFFGTRTSTFEE